MKLGFVRYHRTRPFNYDYMKVVGWSISRDDLLYRDWTIIIQVWFGYFYISWSGKHDCPDKEEG